MNIEIDNTIIPFDVLDDYIKGASSYVQGQLRWECELDRDDMDVGLLGYLWGTALMRATADRMPDEERRLAMILGLKKGFALAVEHPVLDDGLLVELEAYN